MSMPASGPSPDWAAHAVVTVKEEQPAPEPTVEELEIAVDAAREEVRVLAAALIRSGAGKIVWDDASLTRLTITLEL